MIMKKIYVLLFTVLGFGGGVFAQPGAVGNNFITGSPFVCTALTSPSGAFKQARLLANQSSVSATWEFPANCSYPGDVWRPYFGSGVTFNSTIAPAPGPGNGALYNSGNGGASGTLPATTSGRYYTFNVENVAAPLNAYMAVLETNYNPVNILTVSNTTPANATNAVLVTATTNAAPSSGEHIYVRYSTDINFVTSSAISEFTFGGTTGKALIPCQVAGPVYYYVFSSNNTLAQVTADVVTNGRVAYDMLTLNLNNNGGLNYTYTQGAGTNFDGVYSVPSTCYPTVSSFVTALNAGTVTGVVRLFAIAGNAETAPAGGISITQTGTAGSQIFFQKFGLGTYTIQASSALTVGSINDAIIKLIGADYISIDGFTLQENALNIINTPAASNNMTEFGIALLRSTTTDGSQNNTIQSNTISLDKTYRNTFGIYSSARHSSTAVTAGTDATALSGTNAGNKVYGNSISNVNMGITFIGSGAAAFHDVGNDIGGSSAATGNTITNWGGDQQLSGYANNSIISYCIFSNHQTSDNISYNTITSGVAVGAGVATTFAGIRKDYTLSAPTGTFTSTISHNTITMSSAFPSNNFDCIRSQGMTAAASTTTTINITDNNLLNNAITGAGTTSAFTGIANSSQCGTLNITNNIERGLTTVSTSGFLGISNTGAVVTAINITNNSIGDAIAPAVTYSIGAGASTITGINNTSAAATATVNINNNTINGINSVSGGTIQGIANSGGANATFNINNNTVTNMVITGAGAATSMTGISNGSNASALTISGNIIRSNSSTSTTGGFTGINNTGNIVNTATINNNQIGNAAGGAVSYSVATSGLIYGINNAGGATTSTATINSNSIDGISLVTSGVFQGIANVGNAVTASIDNNQLGSVTGNLATFSGAQSSNFIAIVSNSGNANETMTIQGNDIKGIVHGVAGSNTYQLIASNSPVLSQTVSSNTFDNLNLNTSGSVTFIVRQGNMASGASWTCNNNSIVTGFTKGGAGANVIFIYSVSSSVGGSTMTETNNTFSNVTVTGATFVWGILNSEGLSVVSSPTKTITGNTFNNISAPSGQVYVIQVDKGASADCSSNIISNISSSIDIYGIAHGSSFGLGTLNIASNNISTLSSALGDAYGIGGGSLNPSAININNNTITGISSGGFNKTATGIDLTTATTANIFDNTISNVSTSGTSAPSANGIRILGGITANVYRNKIHTISASAALTSTSPAVNGILISAGSVVNANNNFIANLTTPSASLTDAIRGIGITSSTSSASYNLYYNSIYINASTTGTNFGTSGIFHTTNVASTTARLDMIDNIIVNTSTAKGTGFTAAYRRSSTTLANYRTTSDYNLFYAGTPGPKQLIFYDGTNSAQTLTAFQTLVSTREANSISTMPNFTSATDLHLTAVNCQVDGRGVPIGSVTTDIDAQVRDVNTPDIGADEFTASFNSTLAGVVGSAICETRTVSVTGTTFTSNACDLIATILPSGADPVAGKINTCVTLDNMVAALPTYNAEPYLTRHFDIEPTTSTITTTSATITLYFTQAEFDNYNLKNGVWPDLPIGPLDAAGIANLKVTQYHGTATTTPSSPGFYTANAGSGTYINPTDANIVWNGSYWAVTFDITGFSGFYVHTNPSYALPVNFNYLNAVKQGNDHLLTWSVTCNTTPRVTLTLERSADSRNFNSVYSITADAVRCNQPFNYTDAQPLAGINYYRLKIVDADGKITYSNTIALINGTKGFALMNIAPNPVRGNSFKLNATSATASKTDIVISDMQGRIVNRQTIILSAGYNSVDINVGNLAPGTYNIYGMSADEKSSLIRFVKQ